MSWAPERSPYEIVWGGKPRPVTWLGDRKMQETADPDDAVAAVIYIGNYADNDEWAIVPIQFPTDIMLREGIEKFSDVNDEERLTSQWPPILSSQQMTKRKQ